VKTCWILLLFCASTLHAQWVDGQNAAYVIGQANFTSNTAATTANGLNKPWGLAIDETYNKLYVVDWGNHRVLRYALPITQNQPTAELVLGQADFTHGLGNRGSLVTANTLNYPKGIAVYHDTLWVADYSSERVLRFDNAHSISTNGANANGALGGASALTGYGIGTGQSGFYPNGLWFDGQGNLYIADDESQRIVRFNNPSAKASGANADGVLGQTDYTTKTSGTTAGKFKDPYDGAFIGTTLFVVDYSNHRILKFNNAATKANGADADGVVGEPDLTTVWAGVSDMTWITNNITKATAFPMGIAATGNGDLFVSQNLPRISIFANAASKPNFSDADNVLGQSSLGTLSLVKGVAQNTFPGDLRMIRYSNTLNQLFVADFDGNRVLVFNRTTTGITNEAEIPKQFTLLQNYPNPFNPSTQISYQLVKANHTRLIIVNVLGQEVATLVNEEQSAGSHSVSWNASGMASGVYFYRLESGAQTVVKKLVLLR
jgi:hypothetical protein